MPDRVICELCGDSVTPHTHYVVRIDVFADPSLPPVTTEELDDKDFDQTFASLIKQMKSMTADDLQDQVHRRFEYHLCRECQAKFLANPLGKPRDRSAGSN